MKPITFIFLFLLPLLVNAQWTEPEPFINQPGSSMKCPWISGDGLRLYGSTSSFLYWVPIQQGSQAEWRQLPAHINATSTQRSPCESPSGDTLYFVSDPREDAENYGGLDVYYSVRTDTGWGPVYNCGPNVNGEFREWSVSISRDGSLLVVSAIKWGGYGGHDLYYCEKQSDGTWGPATNLGPNVNSWQNDENGSLAPSNDRIFFYLLGPNLGDIWESRKVNGEWQPAVALPSPVNSITETEMDPCISANGRTLYFRKGVSFPINYQFYTTVDTTVVSSVSSSHIALPLFVSLSAYPNPFNPTTTISFDLPYPGTVKLKIFDVTGRVVSTLIDNILSAGQHQILFDGSALSSGLYFARLEAGAHQQTNKLVLLK